jgi:hypothetical protein
LISTTARRRLLWDRSPDAEVADTGLRLSGLDDAGASEAPSGDT